MSNFVPPLKINIVSKEKPGEKDENKGTLRSSVYNIIKTGKIDDFTALLFFQHYYKQNIIYLHKFIVQKSI